VVKPRWMGEAKSGAADSAEHIEVWASAASVSVSVASAVLRLSPARPRQAPVRKWVTGSKRSKRDSMGREAEMPMAGNYAECEFPRWNILISRKKLFGS